MSKLSIFFQILTKSVFKPNLVKHLMEERAQTQEDEEHRLHTYKNMMYEFDTAFKKIKSNGIIISDDVLENDAFHDFSKNKDLQSILIKVKENVGLGIIKKN